MVRTLALLGTILLLHPVSAAGQMAGEGGTGAHTTRAELVDLLNRYEEMAESQAYSRGLREEARQELVRIRQRLHEGDLRVGDRVTLQVEGHTALSDTFAVVTGRRLVLPSLGEVTLEGVLRSELETHLGRHISQFIRDPVVHARALIRVQITGAVQSPGFYTVPSDFLVGDALMMAGGPAASARLDQLRIERGSATVLDGSRLQDAVLEGRTLDQLGIRAGDGIFLPERRSRLNTFRDAGAVVTTLSALLVLLSR